MNRKLLGDDLFRNSIIISLIPPCLILVLFGGKGTVITICLTSLCAYVVDLIGYMEGSVVTLTCMFGAVFVSILHASKHIISEGVIYLPFIIIFGILLSYCFFAILMHFPGLLTEADNFMQVVHLNLLSSLPLLCSSIITWYLCTQIQEIDLGVCFSICYFLYTMYLTLPGSTSGTDRAGSQFPLNCLSENMLQYVYSIPILFSMVFYVVLHHHVIAAQSVLSSLVDFVAAVAIPTVLMAYCAEIHVQQRQHKRFVDAQTVGTIKSIAMMCLLLCQYDNPFLEDIKAFSKLSDFVANALFIVGSVSLVTAMWFSSNRAAPPVQDSDDTVFLTPVSVLIPLTGVIVCSGMFLGLPMYILPACEGGLILYSEFYERQFDFKNPLHTYLAIAFVLCTGLSAMVITLCFAQQTLWSLNFSFESNALQGVGIGGGTVTMRFFCNLCSFLMCLAVVIPPLLFKNRSGAAKSELEDPDNSVGDSLEADSEQLGYLPSSSTVSRENMLRRCNDWLNDAVALFATVLPSSQDAFAWLFTLMNVFVVFMELLVREHVRVNC